MGGSARIATDWYVSSFVHYTSYLRPVHLQGHDPQCFESFNAIVQCVDRSVVILAGCCTLRSQFEVQSA